MKVDQITLIVPPLEQEFGGPQLSLSIIGTRKYPSLGIGYIAAVLEKAGYHIKSSPREPTKHPVIYTPLRLLQILELINPEPLRRSRWMSQ